MTNDQIILKEILLDKHIEGTQSFSEFFEIYSATEILKDYDLSYDDILYGIIGNGGDGGIDSFYIFLNGELLKEDSIVNYNQKNCKIELKIIQSKTSASFNEESINKLKETADDLFNLANELDHFKSRYNADLLDKVKYFRDLYGRLAKTFPKLEISYYYVTQGDSVHPNTKGKVEKLQEFILKLFSGASFKFDFVGSSELLELIRSVRSSSRILEIAENPIFTAKESYVCLVTLSKYFEFISDSGNLARSIFESNVRDYQGSSILVNSEIRKTLANRDSEDFWYLNNGVTIITPKATLGGGKQITIEDPQIVNGLQTSHEIYGHFSSKEEEPDSRTILVRIISEENEEARDRIIKATNSQTSIPPASLRSSDAIHRNIEDFLKTNGYYYDRKKNFYKNQGMPLAKTISIPYMAQAMMAIVLLRPDSARARPSTVINSDADYQKIFRMDMPIDVYLKVIQIVKDVENYLRPTVCNIEMDRKTITNIKFYVAAVYAIKVVGGRENMKEKIAKLPSLNIDETLLREATVITHKIYNDLGASDQIAKGPLLLSNLLSSVDQQVTTQP